MAESIKKAGQIIVDDVTITSSTGFTQTIINQVAGIQLFEDIFTPFISGNIALYDSLDLTNLFPFTGEEVIRLKLRTPSFDGKNRVIDSSFYIYKMSDREKINDSTVVYRLHFITMEAVIDLNKKMSRCFEGKCSDIVKDIITKNYGLQTEKQANIEATPNGIKFISNYWSPVKAINYVCDRSVNAKKSPSFTFFENRNGLNFISLDTLYTTPSLYSFDMNKKSRDVVMDYSYIRKMTVPEGFNYMAGTLEGLYASKQVTYDAITKKYSVRNFDMLSDYGNNNHLNKFPITSKKVIRKNNSTILVTPKAYGNFNNFGDVTDSKVVQKRASLIGQIKSYKIQIEVAGRTDYTVGQKVTLTLYKNEPIRNAESNADILDKVFSGDYIIAAINHIITHEEHTCVMEVVKESLLIDISKGI